MALSETGEIAGSVTGGCVEPDVVLAAEAVLGGGSPQLRSYGIADEEAYAVGLPCGGAVRIFVEAMDPGMSLPASPTRFATRRRSQVVTRIAGVHVGDRVVHRCRRRRRRGRPASSVPARAARLGAGDDERFVLTVAPRPRMYVFGAIDFASSLATLGRFLGYHVTVCDARAAFVTPERFPDADEIVVAWPARAHRGRAHRRAQRDLCAHPRRESSTCRPCKPPSRPPPGTSGRWTSWRTTARREERLREEGVTDRDLARIHAPIGLSISSKTPQEVAVAIGAEIIQSMRSRTDRIAGVSR